MIYHDEDALFNAYPTHRIWWNGPEGSYAMKSRGLWHFFTYWIGQGYVLSGTTAAAPKRRHGWHRVRVF